MNWWVLFYSTSVTEETVSLEGSAMGFCNGGVYLSTGTKKYVPSLKRKKRFHTGRKQIFLEDDISLAQKTKGKIVSKEKFGLSKSIGGASLELNPRNSRRDAIILCSMEHRRDPVILFGFWTFNELSVVDGYCLVSFSKVCFEFSHTWKWIQILLIEAWNKPTIQ